MTRYVIATERSKNLALDYTNEVFYSVVYGCFSKLRYATIFFTFEDTQETVKRLRRNNPCFIDAIEIPITILYKCYE